MKPTIQEIELERTGYENALALSEYRLDRICKRWPGVESGSAPAWVDSAAQMLVSCIIWQSDSIKMLDADINAIKYAGQARPFTFGGL